MSKRPSLSEAALCAHVVAWLRAESYEVYFEVTPGGSWTDKRADIVATRGGELVVVEAKRVLSFDVLAQAEAWRKYASSVYVAVAEAKASRGRSLAWRVAGLLGLGALEVKSLWPIEEGRVNPVFVQTEAVQSVGYDRRLRDNTHECSSCRPKQTPASSTTRFAARCFTHARRTTMPKKARPVAERFWPRVNKHGPVPEYRPDLGPCWLWTGAIAKQTGYGVFGDDGRRTRSSHVIAWELTHGPIADGLETDHLCRVRACCNPSHLEPVTPSENQRRGVAPELSRLRQTSKTHCPRGHAYVEGNMVVRKPVGRGCRACVLRARRLKHAKPLAATLHPIARRRPGTPLHDALGLVTPRHNIAQAIRMFARIDAADLAALGVRLEVDAETEVVRLYPVEVTP